MRGTGWLSPNAARAATKGGFQIPDPGFVKYPHWEFGIRNLGFGIANSFTQTMRSWRREVENHPTSWAVADGWPVRGRFGCMGSRIVKQEPLPGVDWTSIVPPCSWTIP